MLDVVGGAQRLRPAGRLVRGAGLDAPASTHPLRGVFIRAPRIRAVGPAVEVLARVGDEPVAVRQGRVMGVTFHPELTDDDRLHRNFLEIAAAA